MNVIPPFTGNSELDTFLFDLVSSGTGSGGSSSSTVTNDPSSGESSAYSYRYLHVKYADNNTGAGFSDSPVNKTYFGLYNSKTNVESSNPADYNWYLTTGFLSDRKLWYSILGGRQIKFVVSVLAPDTKYIMESGSAIDLDNLTIDSNNLQPDVLAVGKLLNILENSITEDQLFSSLGSRIDLIDADSSVTGSVNNRILQETNNRVSAINAEASTRAQAILDEAAARTTDVSNLQTQINTIVATGSGDTQVILAALQEEQTARVAADQAEATSRETLATQLRGSYTGSDPSQLTTGIIYNERQSRISSESSINSSISSLQSTVTNNYNTLNASITNESTTRASADTALTNQVSNLSSTVTDNYNTLNASITSEASTRASADTSLSTSINALSSTVNNNYNTLNSAIQTEASTRASSDSTLASQITTVQSSVNANTVAIQTEASTRATETGNLFGKYTVKIDNNGYVSGFGLASDPNNGTPVSSFTVRADNFSIASPSGPGIPPSVPFIVYTTPTTVNGITVQPGVYLKSANIETITADKIDSRGLSIKDSSGNIILAAGTPLTSSYITPSNGWLNSNISINSDGTLSNAGSGQVSLNGLGAGAFATLNQINSSNISTYIASAAIGNAYIADAAISSAKINNLQATRAKIANNAVSTSSLISLGSTAISGSPSYNNNSVLSTTLNINPDPSLGEVAQVLIQSFVSTSADNLNAGEIWETQVGHRVNNIQVGESQYNIFYRNSLNQSRFVYLTHWTSASYSTSASRTFSLQLSCIRRDSSGNVISFTGSINFAFLLVTITYK